MTSRPCKKSILHFTDKGRDLGSSDNVQGKEAVVVWRRYCKRVLNEGGRSEVQRDAGGEVASGWNGPVNEVMTREEVEQALGRLKWKTASCT